MRTVLKYFWYAMLLLLFAPIVVSAQNKPPSIDSLMARLSNAPDDTAKVNLYLKISATFVSSKQQKEATEEAIKALELSRKIKWEKGELRSDASLARLSAATGNYKAAYNYVKNASDIAERIKDMPSEKVLSFYVGQLQEMYLKDNKLALGTYLADVGRFGEADTSSIHFYLLQRIGDLYGNYLGDYHNAVDYYLKAKLVAEKAQNYAFQIAAGSLMTTMYRQAHEYKKALKSQQDLVAIAKKSGNKHLVWNAIYVLADIYGDMHDYPEDLHWLQENLALGEELKSGQLVASTQNQLAWTYGMLNDFGKALPLSLQSLNRSDISIRERADRLNTLGCVIRDAPDSVLINNGLDPEKKYQLAIDKFLQGERYYEQLGKNTNVLNAETENFNYLSVAYERKKDFENAYLAYRRSVALRDSLNEILNQKEIVHDDLRREYQKSEDSIKYRLIFAEQKFQQQSLLAVQQRQQLLLNAQEISLANRQKDIDRLKFLKTQAGLEAEKNLRLANEQQLKTANKQQALEQTTLKLQKTEISSKRQQAYYLYAGIGGLLTLLIFIVRNYYNQRRLNKLLHDANERVIKTNHELAEQQEEIVTQRDNLEKAYGELKSTQTQLIQREKMASLGELTAGVAHEIQNPLNFVNNFSEVSTELIGELKEELQRGDIEEATAIATDVEQNLEKIRHHGKRADAIVKGMLEHSRASSGQKEPTDVNALADEYLRLSYHGLRAKDKSFNAELITHFNEELPKVNVVPQDIGRVLLNLFNNAFYAIRKKADTAGADYKPAVEVSTTRQDDSVFISVKDNGIGIPENIRDKIMQPFFTTKPTGEGTGLGLSLSYDIVVKGHGGNITLDSKDGGGAEFTVSFLLND